MAGVLPDLGQPGERVVVGDDERVHRTRQLRDECSSPAGLEDLVEMVRLAAVLRCSGGRCAGIG